MAHNAIDAILEQRRQAEKPPAGDTQAVEDKFFGILVGEGFQENFLELRFRDGLQLCLSYMDLSWFHFVPDEHCIDLEFGGFLVSIKGRGLVPKMFQELKRKRVAWIKEADSELQDHKDNDTFVEEIVVVPPNTFTAEETDT